jgi:hypothetical protein
MPHTLIGTIKGASNIRLHKEIGGWRGACREVPMIRVTAVVSKAAFYVFLPHAVAVDKLN